MCLFLWLIRDKDSGEARNLGVIYGFVYGLGTMHWFFDLFGVFAISLVGLLGGYLAVLATLVGWTRGQRPVVRALLVAVFAVGIEWLRGDAWYLRFPWYTVPHALAQAPVCIAGARWVGVYGLSFLIWLVAAWGAFGRRWIWAGFALLPAFALTLPNVDPPDRRALLLQAEGDGGADALIPRVGERDIDLAVLPEYSYFVGPEEAVS